MVSQLDDTPSVIDRVDSRQKTFSDAISHNISQMYIVAIPSCILGTVELALLCWDDGEIMELTYILLTISATLLFTATFLAIFTTLLMIAYIEAHPDATVADVYREFNYMASTACFSCFLGFLNAFVVSLTIYIAAPPYMLPAVVICGVLYSVVIAVVIWQTFRLIRMR